MNLYFVHCEIIDVNIGILTKGAILNVHHMALISTFEPQHEISNNVVCATSKGSDQPAHTRRLIRAFASRLNIP